MPWKEHTTAYSCHCWWTVAVLLLGLLGMLVCESEGEVCVAPGCPGNTHQGLQTLRHRTLNTRQEVTAYTCAYQVGSSGGG